MKVIASKISIKWERYSSFVVLIFVCIFGIYLRLQGIGDASIWEDEAATSLQALGIMKTFIPTLPSGYVQWSEPPFMAYFGAILWSFTGINILYARFISVAISAVSILLGYRLGREIFDKRLGLIFAFLLAINLWSIAWGRTFRSYSLAELGSLLVLLSIIKCMRHDDVWRRYVMPLIISFIAGLMFHYLLFLLFVSLVLYFLVNVWLNELGKHVSFQAIVSNINNLHVTLRIRINRRPVLLLVFLGVTLVIGLWILLLNSIPLVRMIGYVTSEFFTNVPDQSITWQNFYIHALQRFYGPFLYLSLMGLPLFALKNPRKSLFLSLSFIMPLVILSSVFSSLTVTELFVRYFMPFNVILLLSLGIFFLGLADAFSSFLHKRSPYAKRLSKLLFLILITATLILASSGFTLSINSSQIDKQLRSTGEPITPNYTMAYKYISLHIRSGDAFITSRPDVAAFFFHGQHDQYDTYWIMSNPVEISVAGRVKDGKTIHYMTGYQKVSDLPEFIEVLKTHRTGWIVIPYFHEGPWAIDKQLLAFIKTNLELQHLVSDSTIKVYRWSQQLLNVQILQAPKAYGNIKSVEQTDSGIYMLTAKQGSFQWGGVSYQLTNMPIITKSTAFEFRVKLLTENSVKFDFILEEQDGDRWHLLTYIESRPELGWQSYYITAFDLVFWPLGPDTPKIEGTSLIKIELIGNIDAVIMIQITRLT